MMKKRPRALYLAAALAVYSCGEQPTIAGEPVQSRLLQRDRDGLILQVPAELSPGTVMTFDNPGGSAYVTVYRKLGNSRYLATISDEFTDPAAVDALSIGDVGKTSTLLQSWVALPGDRPSDYWLRLKNHYLFGPAEWLTLENGRDLRDGKLPHNMPFLLSLRQPTAEGYVCLLSPEAGRTVIFFPNTRPGTRLDVRIVKATSENNLTYDARKLGEPVKTALLNVGARGDEPGPTHFVVLLSQRPRPLSDFLPPDFSGKFVDWAGKSIDPWEIGPGYLRRGAPPQESKGVDYLAGDEWGVSHLTFEVLP